VPVIIEGSLEELDCRKWSLNFLKDKIGACPVQCRGKTDLESYRKGIKYCIHETTVGEYIADLQNGHKRSTSRYLAAQNIKRAFPQIGDASFVPKFISENKIHAGPFLWIARNGHYEYTHVDPDEGCLMILEGEKSVRLISNVHWDVLEPNALGSLGRTVQSSVDLENPTPSQKEALKMVNCHFGKIRPGDVLYIPALWWHQVSALSNGVSINIFWGEVGESKFMKKILEEPTLTAFKYWMLNVVEQNKAHVSWPRILSRLEEVLKNFFLKQWHETASTEQIELIKKFIMTHLNISELPPIENNPPKHPPTMKIRGLLHRDRGQDEQNKKKEGKQKLKRSKEENLAILAKKQKLIKAEKAS